MQSPSWWATNICQPDTSRHPVKSPFLFVKWSWKITITSVPICSMYGIFTYIWAIYGVNVGKYSIYGAYGVGSNTTTIPVVQLSRLSPAPFQEERRQAAKREWLRQFRATTDAREARCNGWKSPVYWCFLIGKSAAKEQMWVKFNAINHPQNQHK